VTAALGRAVRAFGRFWWEFLIGDTPELFFATLVIVGAAFLLRHDHLAGIVLLPLLAAVVLVASAYRGRKRVTGPEDQPVAEEDVGP
jgi:hypothetical protein